MASLVKEKPEKRVKPLAVVQVTRATHDRLADVCNKQGYKFSGLVDRLVREGLDRMATTSAN